MVIRKIKALMFSGLIALGLMVPVVALAPTAAACPANWTFGVGGVNDGGASFFPNWSVDTKIVYGGGFNDMRGGINAVHRDVNAFRANCPGTRITLAGHSQGAAIVHVYVTENAWAASFLKGIVLYADPKQAHTGISGEQGWTGYPLAGTDDFFNGVPAVSICHGNDVICNRGAGWFGYLFQEAHTRPYWPHMDVRWWAGQHGHRWV